MKLAVITDTTAVLSDDLKAKENLFVLDIPIMIGGVSYVEGTDLSLDDFYKKMAMWDCSCHQAFQDFGRISSS